MIELWSGGIRDTKREFKGNLNGKVKTRKMTKKEKEYYSKFTGSGKKVSKLDEIKGVSQLY